MSEILSPQQIQRLSEDHDEAVHGNREASNPSFLRLLSSISRKQLNLLMTERRCVPGEVVYREGDAGDNLYMIWSGQVVAFMGQPDSPTILGYRGAGETIGEMSLLDNQPRSAWVVALTDLRLLKITREAFYQLLQQEPSLGMSIMEALSSRLRGSDQERSLGKTSERRLISQLSELEIQKQQLLELQQVRQETSDLIIHDLRNPLGSIQLSISMLEMVLPEEVLQENAQLLEIARNSCSRMMRLVDSLLDVSRMESGEAQLYFAPLDLPALLHSAAGSSLAARDRGIQMVVELPEALPTVSADRDKIERVVTNLVDNAVKYTPNGGQITLAARAEAEHLLLSVTDTGPGIPEEQRQRIFERFAQVKGDTRARRGFGLGLAYCRLAVEAHGGRIWVEPGPGGVGSRFAFTLPIALRN